MIRESLTVAPKNTDSEGDEFLDITSMKRERASDFTECLCESNSGSSDVIWENNSMILKTTKFRVSAFAKILWGMRIWVVHGASHLQNVRFDQV